MNHHGYLLKRALSKKAEGRLALLARLAAKLPWKWLAMGGVAASPLIADHLKPEKTVKPSPAPETLQP